MRRKWYGPASCWSIAEVKGACSRRLPRRGEEDECCDCGRGQPMAVKLEWVRMPSDIYFCTICRNGIPLPEPTNYLLTRAHPAQGSTRTIRTYAQWLLPFFKWLDRQGLALTDLALYDIQRFRKHLTLTDLSFPPLLRKGANSADVTITSIVAATCRFLIWCMGPDDMQPLFHRKTGPQKVRSRFYFSHLTIEGIGDELDQSQSFPKKKRVLPKFLTQEQLDTCRTWIMDTYAFDKQLQLRNRAIFELLWDGALRRGALLSLKLENIDWLRGTLVVSFDERDYRAAWYQKRPNYRAAKTGEYQVIVADQTLQWLDRYRQEARPVESVQLGHKLFFCEHAPLGKDHGQPLSLETLLYFWGSMSRSLVKGGTGIHVTPHMLRHTWSTMALEDGVPTEVVQHQLGHRSPRTTEDFYSHVAPETTRADLQRWRQNRPERYGITECK